MATKAKTIATVDSSLVSSNAGAGLIIVRLERSTTVVPELSLNEIAQSGPVVCTVIRVYVPVPWSLSKFMTCFVFCTKLKRPASVTPLMMRSSAILGDLLIESISPAFKTRRISGRSISTGPTGCE